MERKDYTELKRAVEVLLPRDEIKVEKLRKKLDEYSERVRNGGKFLEGKLCHSGTLTDDALKMEIMDYALRNGGINCRLTYEDLVDRYGKGAVCPIFYNIIADYLETSGKNLKGGTGLPKVEGEPRPVKVEEGLLLDQKYRVMKQFCPGPEMTPRI